MSVTSTPGRRILSPKSTSQESSVMTWAQPRLPEKSDLHLARKLWHSLGVLTAAAVYSQLNHDQALRLLGVVGGFAIALDLVRLQIPKINAVVLRIFGLFMRERERNSLTGVTYFMIGALITVWFFPREVVLISLLFLALADPLASYVGIRWGKDHLVGRKSLQGAIAAFLVCWLIVIGALFYWQLMLERWLFVSLLGGLIGAASELIPVGKLDDNLTLPVISATLLYGLFWLAGGL